MTKVYYVIGSTVIRILPLLSILVTLPHILPISAAPTDSELAAYWAPVWYQDTDLSDPDADYITNFDFDGDWKGENNWERQERPEFKLNCYIYYWVMRTATHVFLGYADFHPRDWQEINVSIMGSSHENDMEGCLLVIKNDGSNNGHGRIELLLTVSHTRFWIYKSASSVIAEELDGIIDLDDNHHPILYVEAKGHGIYGNKDDTYYYSFVKPDWINDFPGGDGVIYKYSGTPGIPTSANDRNVGYALKSIDEIWARRYDYVDTFSSYGVFKGNTHGVNRAKAPWGWDFDNDGPVDDPRYFCDPAYVVDYYIHDLGEFSRKYTQNPYEEGYQQSSSVLLSEPHAQPRIGTFSDNYTFWVKYSHSHSSGGAPQAVILNLDGLQYDMYPSSPSPYNYLQGVQYTKSLGNLDTGVHEARFETIGSRVGPVSFFVGPSLPCSITMTASPQSLQNNGISTSTIRATIKDSSGNPMPSKTVEFSSNGFPGVFSGGSGTPTRPNESSTDASGIATVSFQPRAAGSATISAICEGLSGQATLTVTGSSNLVFEIRLTSSSTLNYHGEIRVKLPAGTVADRKPLTLSTSYGQLHPLPAGEWCNQFTTNTDENGYVSFDLNIPAEGSVVLTMSCESSSYVYNTRLGGTPVTLAAFKTISSGNAIRDAAWTADNGHLLTGGANTVNIWDATTWQIAGSSSVADLVYSVAVSPDGSRFVTSDECNYFTSPSGTSQGRNYLGGAGYDIDWSSSNKIAVAGSTNTFLFNSDGSSQLTWSNGTMGSAESVRFSPDGNYVAYGFDGSYLVVRNSSGGLYCQKQITANSGNTIGDIAWSPDSSQIAIAVQNSGHYIYNLSDLTSANPVRVLTAGSAGQPRYCNVDWSPVDNPNHPSYGLIVGSERDLGVVIWRASDGNTVYSSLAASMMSNRDSFVRWSRDGNTFAFSKDASSVSIVAPWDNIPPIISNFSYTDYQQVTTPIIRLNATVADNRAVKTVKVALNGGTEIPVSLTVSDFSIDLNLNPGDNIITVTASDFCGNNSSTNLHIKRLVDDISPSISDIDMPTSMVPKGSPILVTAKVSDTFGGQSTLNSSSVVTQVRDIYNNSVSTVSMSDDGTGGDFKAGDGTFTAKWETGSALEGYYLVKICAADISNNTAAAGSHPVTLASPPVIGSVPQLTPTNPTNLNSCRIDTTVADDSEIAIASILFSTNNGASWSKIYMVPSLPSLYGLIPPQAPGIVMYKFYAQDVYGASSESAQHTYQVMASTSTPSMSVTSPTISASWQAGTQHDVTWTYTGDPGASVKIELLKGGSVNSTIVGSTSVGSGGNGSYPWTIPAGQAYGIDYQVKVTSLTNSAWSGTSPGCTITAVPPIPEFLRKWGSPGTGDKQFNNPVGVAVDASGNVYVTDWGNSRVQKFNSAGDLIAKWGSSGSLGGQFNHPYGVAVDASGNVYVADCDNNRVQKFSNTGGFIAEWGSPGSGDGQFVQPQGIAVDNTGNVYVAEYGNDRVQKFNSAGVFVAKWGVYGSGDRQFKHPIGVAVDASGNVYVADSGNHRIQRFNSVGDLTGRWGSSGSGDGQFAYPFYIAADASGNVYVTDYGNNRVQKFNSTGGFVAKWGSSGSGDGNFAGPEGIAIDASGNVYVADSQNQRIQVFRTRFVRPGDANGDGAVNAVDITKVERIVAGLDAATLGADANQDGKVNAQDITKVERILVGLD